MSNLVPTPRTDKNGRTVTRHMKPETATNTKGNQPLPPVTLTSKSTQRSTGMLGGLPADERAAKIDQLMEWIKDDQINLYENDEEDDYATTRLKTIRGQLGKYPTPLLNDLHHEIKHDNANLASTLIDLLSAGNRSVADVHEYFVFRPHLNPDLGYIIVSSFIDALHHYPQLPKAENYAEASAEDQEKIIALLKVTEAVASHPTTNRKSLTDVREGVLLSGDDLIQLVLTRPADADQIARIITERKTTDTTLITAILDSNEPALSHGII